MNRFCFILFVCFCKSLIAQNNDTIIVLKDAYVISAKIFRSSAFAENIGADSIIKADFKSSNLGDLLSNFGTANIKSYGPGMLSSVSLRGASAAQTSINWNGISINNPMTGQSDLSLIPVFFTDEISIQSGGNSSVWGSGSIGGNINIDNIISQDTGITLMYEKIIGNYGLRRDNIKTSVNWENGTISLRFFNHDVENNFPYKNIAKQNSPEEKLTNAKGGQTGVLPELLININKNQTFIVRSWIQKNEQQIPPTMLTINKNENQSENFIRSIAEWKTYKNKNYLLFKAAYFNNVFEYSSATQPYTSIHKSKLSLIEAESSIDILRNFKLMFIINNTLEKINSTDYQDIADRNSTSVVMFLKWNLGKTFDLSVSCREEYYNSTLSPFLFSFGINKMFNNKLSIKAATSRNFRYPSFNDLYWNPGGNPDLKPESSYSQEISIKWKSISSSFKPEVLISVYNTNITNRIMWLPEGSAWTAGNWSKVWSRGAECNFLSLLKISENISLNVRISGNYNRTTGETSNYASSASDGKQLIYLPLFSSNSSASLLIKKFNFNWYYHISGKRYTSSDNTSFLEPYNYSSFSVSKLLIYRKINTNCFIRIDNVFNNQYQITEWRPMPPLNYQIGMSIKLNN